MATNTITKEQAFGTPLPFDKLTLEGKGVLTKIVSYQNEKVVVRYAEDHNVSIDEARRVFQGLLQYLVVCAFTNGKRTPSKIIDECWHTFILFMKEYETFCEEWLRGMIYHDPALDESGYPYYEHTRKAAEALFGELDPMVWPVDHPVYARCISTKDYAEPRFLDLVAA